MEFNLITYIYLFIRLAPFIIVSCFTLNSILNLDLKGVVYIAGLLLACFVTTMVSKISFFKNDNKDANILCNLITLTGTGSVLSDIPLGQTTLSYTFMYLASIIIKYNDNTNALITKNMASFILFPLLIICDGYWTYYNKCTKPVNIIFAFLIGSGIGAAWALTLDASKMFELQYFNGISNRDVCSRPSKSIFRCTPKK
jgi:hypothetical protein